MRTVAVLSGPERRRRWTLAEKARIIEESLAPEAIVAEVARRLADILARIAEHPVHRLDDLLPWKWHPHGRTKQAA